MAEVTKGKAFYVSDEEAIKLLHQAMVDTSTRGCLAKAVASVSIHWLEKYL